MIRGLVNRRAGAAWSFNDVQQSLDRYWDVAGNDVSYQFCQSPGDGHAKAKRAVEQGVDVLIVMGGDGTVNAAGSALIDSDTALGVIPMGSGNGFARHFDIPLRPEDAARALAHAEVRRIDVGMVNDRPFLVTCSMAWDATIVKSFEKSPVRGIVPYIFAGVYEFLGYEAKEIKAELETGEVLTTPDPVVFTVANLTQYGGGAVIASDAEPDDGALDLVVAQKQDIPILVANVHRMLSGSIQDLPRVVHRRFRSLTATRVNAGPIQIDGELVEGPRELRVRVAPRCLNVLVPHTH